jgi:molybdenum cofactor guanylyltransferase
MRPSRDTAEPTIVGCAAAILVGGRGQRMGGVRKPLLFVGGQRVLARQLAVLRPLMREIVLCADEAEPFSAFGLPVLVDHEPGLGPLPAMAAALGSVTQPLLFVVAGDMPYLSAAAVTLTVHRLQETEADAAAPLCGGFFEPLHTCYRRSCLPVMERALSTGQLSAMSVLAKVRVAPLREEELRLLDPQLSFLRNLNTPDDVP